MAGEILTPLSIWSDLEIPTTPQAQTIGEYREGDYSLERIRIDGKQCEDGQVKIYAVIARSRKKKTLPAIFVVQKFLDGADETLALDLAKKGFCAFIVNVGGNDGVNNNYTEYPESLSFANYKHAKNNMSIFHGQVKSTCWYEWGVTCRYALCYLRSLDFVEKIAGLGIADAATVVWHLSATENFDALAFIMNAGWNAYKGNYKFLARVDEQFSDDKIKYLAGIEPQAYAPFIKAPTFIATATNSAEFDFDRSHDTYARINDSLYTAISYTVGATDSVGNKGYNDLIAFFNQTLIKGKNDIQSQDLKIKTEVVDGQVKVSVNANQENLKEIYLYASEEQYDPALRQWQKVEDYKMVDDEYQFNFLPYNQSGVAFFFAIAVYKNGTVINSDVVARKFEVKEILPSHKSKIIYSSREENAICSFYPIVTNVKKPSCLSIYPEIKVEEKKGAMDIVGITCDSGLLSFKVGMKKYRPEEDGILLLDAYLKHGGVVTVKLITNYFGERVEYLSKATVPSGEIWQNLKFPITSFKSVGGMAIRSIEKIQAIEILGSDEYLLNNVLWV